MAISEDVADYWRNSRWMIPVRVLPNPIDLPQKSSEASTFPKRNAFIAIGRIDKQKNYEYLIATAAHLSADWSIEIYGVGESDYVDELNRRSMNNPGGAKVTLMGNLPRPKLLANLPNFQALVMTSDFEGEPTVVLEAAAVGLPVVGRDTPGLGSCIRKVGGIAVDTSATPREFAQILQDTNFSEIGIIDSWRNVHDPEFAAHQYCSTMGIDCRLNSGSQPLGGQ